MALHCVYGRSDERGEIENGEDLCEVYGGGESRDCLVSCLHDLVLCYKVSEENLKGGCDVLLRCVEEEV